MSFNGTASAKPISISTAHNNVSVHTRPTRNGSASFDQHETSIHDISVPAVDDTIRQDQDAAVGDAGKVVAAHTPVLQGPVQDAVQGPVQVAIQGPVQDAIQGATQGANQGAKREAKGGVLKGVRSIAAHAGPKKVPKRPHPGPTVRIPSEMELKARPIHHPFDQSNGPVIIGAVAELLSRLPGAGTGTGTTGPSTTTTLVFLDPAFNNYFGGLHCPFSVRLGRKDGQPEPILHLGESELRQFRGEVAALMVCDALVKNLGATLYVWTSRYTKLDDNHRGCFIAMVKKFAGQFKEQHPPTLTRTSHPYNEKLQVHGVTFGGDGTTIRCSDTDIENLRILFVSTKAISFPF